MKGKVEVGKDKLRKGWKSFQTSSGGLRTEGPFCVGATNSRLTRGTDGKLLSHGDPWYQASCLLRLRTTRLLVLLRLHVPYFWIHGSIPAARARIKALESDSIKRVTPVGEWFRSGVYGYCYYYCYYL